MAASSDLQDISRRVKEELGRSVFSLQTGGRYLFTDNQLQRRVSSAPASELTVAVELCNLEFLMRKNYSELLNDIEPDAVLSTEKHNFYQTVFLSFSAALLQSRDLLRLERLFSLVLNSRLRKTGSGEWILNHYVTLLLKTQPEEAKEIIEIAGDYYDPIVQSERLAALSECYFRLGLTEAALRIASNALVAVPKVDAAKWAHGRLLLVCTFCRVESGEVLGDEINEASMMFKKSKRSTDFDYAELWACEGMNWAQQGKLEEAEEKLSKAYEQMLTLEQHFSASEIAVHYVNVLISLRKLREAEGVLNEILKLSDNYHSKHLMNYAICLDLTDRYEQASQTLLQLEGLLKSDNNQADEDLLKALTLQGRCLMHLGQTRQAETAFREAEALFVTGDNSSLDHRAENLMQLGISLAMQDPSIKLPARPLKSSITHSLRYRPIKYSPNKLQPQRPLSNPPISLKNSTDLIEVLQTAVDLAAIHCPNSPSLFLAYVKLVEAKLSRLSTEGVKELLDLALSSKPSEDHESLEMLTFDLLGVDWSLLVLDYAAGEEYLMTAVSIFLKWPVALEHSWWGMVKQRINNFYACKLGQTSPLEAKQLITKVEKAKRSRRL